jgi:hypothetical protein
MTSVWLSVEHWMSKELPHPYFNEAWLARKSVFETKVRNTRVFIPCRKREMIQTGVPESRVKLHQSKPS